MKRTSNGLALSSSAPLTVNLSKGLTLNSPNGFTLSLSNGFSMIELLVGLAIIALLITLMMVGPGLQLSKGYDSRRKSDLARLKIAFEDYYNDYGCYPPPNLLQHCYSSDLSPYMSRVPCDPLTKKPYPYYRDDECKWYGAFTTLATTSDPVITALHCSPSCGITNSPVNYAVTNGSTPLSVIVNLINGEAIVATPIPTIAPFQTPRPSPTPAGRFACDPDGQCNVYNDPIGKGCPITFHDAVLCQQQCADPANRCKR